MMNKKVFGIFLCTIFILSSFVIFANHDSQTNTLITTNFNAPLTSSSINVTHPSDLELIVEDPTNHPLSWNLTEQGLFNYLGAFTFTDDANGASPIGWVVSEASATHCDVVSSLGTHSKVVEYWDNNINVGGGAYMDDTFAPQTNGTVEWWYYRKSGYTAGQGSFEVSFRELPDSWHFAIEVTNDDVINYGVGGDTIWANGIKDNTWYHFQVKFSCVSDTFEIWINGEKKGTTHNFYSLGTSIGKLRFGTWSGGTAGNTYIYIDAIDYSWTLGYHLNRNWDYGPVDYQGMWSFTNDEVGSQPAGWTASSGTSNSIELVESIGTHRKVVEFWDNSASGNDVLVNSFVGVSTGTVELYLRRASGWSGGNGVLWVNLREGTARKTGFALWDFKVDAYGGVNLLPNGGWKDDQWYHFRIQFDCGTDQARFWINGTDFGWKSFYNTASLISNLELWTEPAVTTGNTYIYLDAVDCSWGGGYSTSRNWQYGPVDYVGCYSFTEDVGGTHPAGWTITESINTSIEVLDTLDNHHQVVRLQDDNNGQVCLMSNSFTAQTTGTIEFWIYGKEQGCTEINLMSGATRRVVLIFYWNAHYVRNWRGGTVPPDEFPVAQPNLTANVWHHIRISFTSPTFNFYYDGVNKGVYNYYTSGSINQIRCWTSGISGTEVGLLSYLDAIDYSWAPGYVTNRNLQPGFFNYRGLYSFSEDAVAANPTGWTVQEDSSTYTNVTGFMGTHRKVVEFWDNTNTGLTTATNSFTDRSTGTIEFWYCFQKGSASYDNFVCRIRSGTTIGVGIAFINNINQIQNELDNAVIASGLTGNRWYHIRIVFSCSTDTYQFWINGTNKGTFGFYNGLSTANNLFYSTSAGYTYGNFYAWIDAVDYSWASGYYTNRNMEYPYTSSSNTIYALFQNGSQKTDWQYWMNWAQVNYNVNASQLGVGIHNISLIYNNRNGQWFHDDVIVKINSYVIEGNSPHILNVTQTPLAPSYQEEVSVIANITDDTQIQTVKIETNNSIVTPPYDYLGAFSFSADSNGADPTGWMIHEPINTSLQVIESKETHNKVVEFLCNGTDWDGNWMWNDFQSKTIGSVEFWTYIVEIEPLYGGASDATQFFVGLLNSSASGPAFPSSTWGPMLGFEAEGTINYNVGSKSLYTIGTWTPNTWQHYRIDFNTATDKFDVYQDGIKIGTQCSFRYAQSAVKRAYIGYGWTESHSVECEVYVDAIDFSWAPGYYINRSMNYASFTNYTMTKTSGTYQDGTWNYSFLSYPVNKTIAYRIYASDVFGNTNVTTQFNFGYFDLQAPTMTELTQEPIAPGYFEGVNVTVRITDDSQIGNVELETNATGSFLIFPMTQLTGTSQDGYWNYFFNSYYWNRTIAYRIIAVDTIENYRVSNWSNFGYFDLSAPTITELTQEPIAPGYFEGVNVTVRITDDSQIGNVELETNATGSFLISPMTQLTGTSQDGYWNYFFNSYYWNRTIAYRIIAADTLGNYRVAGWYYFGYFDMVGPVVTELTQVPMTPGYLEGVNVTVRITDSSAIWGVEIETNVTGSFLISPMTQLTGTSQDGYWNYFFNSYPLNKTIAYHIIAVDTLGNYRVDGWLYFGYFDLVAPNIASLDQTPLTPIYQDPVRISVRITDSTRIATVSIEANQTGAFLIYPMIQMSGTLLDGVWNFTFTNYPLNKFISYRIIAVDVLGNINTTGLLNFGVFDFIDPLITNLLQNPAILTQVKPVNITAFISDNFKVSSVKIETNATGAWANYTMALLSGSTQSGIWTYIFTTYPINHTIAYRIFAIDVVNRTVVSGYSTFGIFPIISWYIPTELDIDVNIRGNRKVDITFEFTNTGNTKWLNLNFTIILPENWTATVYTKSIGQLSAGQKITVTFRVTAPPNVVEKQVYLAYILFETNINETGTEKTGTILVPMTGIEILGVWVWIVIVIGSAAAVMSTSLIVVRKRHAVAAGEQRMKSKSKNYELLKADVFKEFPGTYSVFSPELIERINSLVGLSENEKNLLIEYISQLDEDEAQAWLNEFQNRPMD